MTREPTPGPSAHPFEPFIRRLSRRLRDPLPGLRAQSKMAPQPRAGWDQATRPAPRQGGVLVLLYPAEGELHLPLIVRPVYDGVHSGQIGFPGGGQEEIDGDLTATALREAYEEIGVEPAAVEVLGHLSSLYIQPSNYEVHPTVGWMPSRPSFHTDPYEVAHLLEVRLNALRDPANRQRTEWQLRERRALVPHFNIQGQTIWGATAMMLSELLDLVDEFAGSSPR